MYPKVRSARAYTVMKALAVSKAFRDTQGKWEYAELFGKTGPNQTTLEVCCRIGVYGQEDKGKAWFDDYTVNALANAPSESRFCNFMRTSRSRIKKRNSEEYH